MAKIQSHPGIQWRYVESSNNPADLASRGGQITDLWRNGPEWLAYPERWPENPVIVSTLASEAEAKSVRAVMKLAKRGVPEEPEPEAIPEDVFDDILKKHPLRKALRIQARVRRWNSSKEPINANQIQAELNWWIKRAQQ